MRDLLWKLEGICLAGTHLPRLAEVTCHIRRGVTAIMGCSGAGKTSLLNLLVGFETQDAGSLIGDVSGEGFSLPLFWVPQDAGLWPHLTARDHLEAVMVPGTSPDRIPQMLDRFGILEKASARPDRLSMGERSRLAVARALAADAAVLVMDEPLAHVDWTRATEYWGIIRNHLAERGASLVFATHLPEAVMGEADRVICLEEGRLLYEGPVDELYWNPATRELAECLGAVNWLPQPEARLWLADGADARSCYRPEQIRLTPSENGPLVVKSFRFRGALAEAELLHEESGRVRRFYHRPSGAALRPGVRVVLKALLVLLVFFLVGCGDAVCPQIPVRAARYWSMPPDGHKFPAPRAVAIGREDEVFVVDTAARVLVFGADGTLRTHWRMPEVEAGNPEGLCVMDDGRIAVCDTHYGRVILFDGEGKVVGKIGRYGKGPGEFIYPVAVVQDTDGDLYVCEYGGNDRVQKFTPDGDFVLSFGSFGTGPDQFQRPSGMAWSAGKLYVADAINNRIQVFAEDGRFLGSLGGAGTALSLRYPYDIAVGGDGALYVAEYGAGRVSKVSPEGQLLGRYGSTGRGEGQFQTPWGVAVDSKMRLRVADTGNRRIVGLEL